MRESNDAHIHRHPGIAGQVAYSVQTPEGRLTFVGSHYGGPVVMVMPGGYETFVTDPGRFGKFDKAWVKAFMARGAS
jgi:hypothetical protein